MKKIKVVFADDNLDPLFAKIVAPMTTDKINVRFL